MQTVYNRTTGEAFTRDPVDCREMLATGQYSESPVESASVAEAPAKETAKVPAAKKTAAKTRRQAE